MKNEGRPYVEYSDISCVTCKERFGVWKNVPCFDGEPSPRCVNKKCPESTEWLLDQKDPGGYPVSRDDIAVRCDELRAIYRGDDDE